MWTESDWTICKDPAHAAGPMWMDGLHVRLIYDLCMRHGFRNMMEIGCWDGFSTSALVQAKIDGSCGWLRCVDVEARPALWQVLSKARDHWSFCRCTGVEAIEKCYVQDLYVIDSSHDMATSQQELGAVLEKGGKTVIAHDVGVTQTHSPGPQWMRSKLTELGWHILVDEAPRQGMATHRGIMLATQVLGVYERSKEFFTALENVI